MRVLATYVRIVDAISEVLGRIAVWLVLITVLIGFYNVVARYLGRFIGVQLSSNLFIELQWYLYSLVFFFGFAYILKHGVNVRVDFLYANWGEKRRAWVDIIGHVLFLVPFCIIGIYVTINPVLSSWGLLPSGEWGTWEMSPDPNGLPRAPIKTMIILAFITLLAQTISELIKLYATVTDQKQVIQDVQKQDVAEAPIRIE